MNMDQEKIKELLKKYYSGTTSLEEEQELKIYFTENNVPDSLLPEKELFSYFEYKNDEDIPGQDFEQKLIKNIISEESKTKKRSNIRILYNALRVAASITILAASYLILDKNTNMFHAPYNYVETENPEIAYMEAKNALLLVSRNLNAGMSGLENLEKLNSGKKEFQKLKALNSGIFNLSKIPIFEGTKNINPNKN